VTFQISNSNANIGNADGNRINDFIKFPLRLVQYLLTTSRDALPRGNLCLLHHPVFDKMLALALVAFGAGYGVGSEVSEQIMYDERDMRPQSAQVPQGRPMSGSHVIGRPESSRNPRAESGQVGSRRPPSAQPLTPFGQGPSHGQGSRPLGRGRPQTAAPLRSSLSRR